MQYPGLPSHRGNVWQHRGLTLAELIVASSLSLIVLTLVYALFSSGITVQAHLDGEVARNQAIGVIMKELTVDVREANLAYATYCTDESSSDSGDGRLRAVAIPRARDIRSGRFITDSSSGMPCWKSLSIYYQLPDEHQLRKLEIAPVRPSMFDPQSTDFVLPVSPDDLRRFVTVDKGYEPDYTLCRPSRIIAANMESFDPVITKKECYDFSEGTFYRYYLAVTVDIFFTELHNEKGSHVIFTREIFSCNSMYQFPGASDDNPPLPLPTPLPDDEPPTWSLENTSPVILSGHPCPTGRFDNHRFGEVLS